MSKSNRKKKGQRGSRRKGRGKRSHPGELTKQQVVIDHFLACPRCSFFLAGYRVQQTDFEEAVKASDDDWLNLTWNEQTRNLLYKSFGNRLDQEAEAYQLACRDCSRVYHYRSAEVNETDKATLDVQINWG